MIHYPVYIISKGRHDSRLTSKALEEMRVPYHIVVEPQEYDLYAAVIDPAKIYTLPFSNLGQGSIPARNWVWEHAIKTGAKRHWILDDNIRQFRRLVNTKRILICDDEAFRECERFTEQYANIALSGLNYEMFVVPKSKGVIPPVKLNTRIYSCILIDNAIPFRWRGRYNEDTDLSLRVLKAGYCTALLNAYMCKKIATLTMKGGNTDVLYKQTEDFDGRLEMAKSLVAQHPDVAKITRKWGRWQHHVDYRPFAGNRLKRIEDVQD